VAPLVQVYRLFGPIPLLRSPLSDALVGAEAVPETPHLVAEVMGGVDAVPR
jgi:hypothetical protein